MSKPNKSIALELQGRKPGEGDIWVYLVVKASNTTWPRVGDSLTEKQVDALHASGIEYTIIPRKL